MKRMTRVAQSEKLGVGCKTTIILLCSAIKYGLSLERIRHSDYISSIVIFEVALVVGPAFRCVLASFCHLPVGTRPQRPGFFVFLIPG